MHRLSEFRIFQGPEARFIALKNKVFLGDTALMEAARNGHTESIAALTAAGANVDHAAGNGATALMVAAQNRHTEIADALRAAEGLAMQNSSCLRDTLAVRLT